MGDLRRRRLLRVTETGRSDEDEVQLLAERMRCGDLSESAVEAAAHGGVSVAQSVLGWRPGRVLEGERLSRADPRAWGEVFARWGLDVCVPLCHSVLRPHSFRWKERVPDSLECGRRSFLVRRFASQRLRDIPDRVIESMAMFRVTAFKHVRMENDLVIETFTRLDEVLRAAAPVTIDLAGDDDWLCEYIAALSAAVSVVIHSPTWIGACLALMIEVHPLGWQGVRVDVASSLAQLIAPPTHQPRIKASDETSA